MVANIGRAVADEVVEIAVVEGQDRATWDAHGSLAVVEHSLEVAPEKGVVVEVKIPLQTMDPLPSLRVLTDTQPPPSNLLAMVMSSFGTRPFGPSLPTSAELDEDLQHLLAPLYQEAGEANDSGAIAMDLSFLESMATGVKEMQAWHNQKWQELKERRESAGSVDQKLKDKCLELREWHGKQSKVLMRQQEMLLMMRGDIMAHEACLADDKASPDARELEISLQEEKLKATLCAKDDDTEALVRQCPKDLEEKHGAALDAIANDSTAQLKKIAYDIDAASIAKADLDQ